jgi:hypothetical protein
MLCFRKPSAKAQKNWDNSDANGCQLLGAGRKIRSSEDQLAAVDTLEEHLSTLHRGQQESDWVHGEVVADSRAVAILRYSGCHPPGGGGSMIDSCLFFRAVSKKSFWVLVQYERQFSVLGGSGQSLSEAEWGGEGGFAGRSCHVKKKSV